MELISSIFNIARNVSQTDREFRILKEKLVFHIKKAQTAHSHFRPSNPKLSFIAENLEGRLRDANERLSELEALLSSSANQEKQSISLKDKIKLSLPFNNEKEKISQTIEDLRQATEELLNNQLPEEATKQRLEPPPSEQVLDHEIDELYEMGPTIQENNALEFAMEFTKNHTVELRVQAGGPEGVLGLLSAENRLVIIEKTCERASKEEVFDLFQLGRMNFKKQYKGLKAVFPDIDKISKLNHFKIIWKRQPSPIHLDHPKGPETLSTHDYTQKKNDRGENNSQKKEEADQFFSVPEGIPEELANGALYLEKQMRSLYRRTGGRWVKVEEDSFELLNGDEVAVCLNKDLQADLFFKVTYRFK